MDDGLDRDEVREAMKRDPAPVDRPQSRGERFDELSGGGRSADSVSFDPDDGSGEAEI